jgi:hypothetical protein
MPARSTPCPSNFSRVPQDMRGDVFAFEGWALPLCDLIGGAHGVSPSEPERCQALR